MIKPSLSCALMFILYFAGGRKGSTCYTCKTGLRYFRWNCCRLRFLILKCFLRYYKQNPKYTAKITQEFLKKKKVKGMTWVSTLSDQPLGYFKVLKNSL